MKKFELWDQTYPKRVFPFKNGKSEHHHWIVHIRICLGTKFHLKLTLLIIWTKFVKKGYFWYKAEESLLRASIVVTSQIKLFPSETHRHNNILMSFTFLVAEIIISKHLLVMFFQISKYLTAR